MTATTGDLPQPTTIRSGSIKARTELLLQQLGAHATLIFFGIIFMLPFLWMVSSSLKPTADIFRSPCA